jgi:hypothetical protein
MALNDRALITVDTYVKAARIPEPKRDETLLAQVEFAINAASDYIETETNRTFLSGSMETEIFDGVGFATNIPSYHMVHKLQHAPITSSPNAPRLYLLNGTSWEAVDTDTYTYNATDGVIYFHANYYFIQGKNNYKVEYYYGYENRAAIPADLQMLTVMSAKRVNITIDHIGVKTVTTSDESLTYSLDKISLLEQRILDKYTR